MKLNKTNDNISLGFKITILKPEDIENREKYQDAEVLETEAAVEQDQETLQRISEAQ